MNISMIFSSLIPCLPAVGSVIASALKDRKKILVRLAEERVMNARIQGEITDIYVKMYAFYVCIYTNIRLD
jgi:hypothetical protein